MQHRRLESGGVRRDRSARCVLSRRWRGQAAATYCSSGSRQAVLFCSPLLAFACLLVSYCASSTERSMALPRNGDRLDPARRFERDAVGRELVSRPRRAVPAAPDGLVRLAVYTRAPSNTPLLLKSSLLKIASAHLLPRCTALNRPSP